MYCVWLEIMKFIDGNVRVLESLRVLITDPKKENAFCPDPNPHPVSVWQGSCFSCRRIWRAVCRWRYHVVSLTETIEPINPTRSVCLLSFRFFWRTPSEDRNKNKWDGLCHLVVKLQLTYSFFSCIPIHLAGIMCTELHIYMHNDDVDMQLIHHGL